MDRAICLWVNNAVLFQFAILSHLELGKDALAWGVCVDFLWTPCHPYHLHRPKLWHPQLCLLPFFRLLQILVKHLHVSSLQCDWDMLTLFCIKCLLFLPSLLWSRLPTALSWDTVPQHSFYPAIPASSELLDQAKECPHASVSALVISSAGCPALDIVIMTSSCYPGSAWSSLCRAGFFTPNLKQQAVPSPNPL